MLLKSFLKYIFLQSQNKFFSITKINHLLSTHTSHRYSYPIFSFAKDSIELLKLYHILAENGTHKHDKNKFPKKG